MSNQIKKTNQKVILGLLILGLFTFNSYSMVAGNWSECAYRGECDGGESTSLIIVPMSTSMRTLIIEGAGYFLDSHSGMQAFLNRVEMSEMNGSMDYNEIREILYQVIEDMEKAREAYYNLKIKADNTPYRQDVIQNLLAFNYDEFQAVNGLTASVFENVKNYLSKGDVRGIYGNMLSGTEEILSKLYEVKQMVDSDQFPEITMLWRINQLFSETLLFGQFTSAVFKYILK